MSRIFHTLKSILLVGVFFLFPLFFLPVTQEFFLTQKQYLLAVIAFIFLIISTVELLITKSVRWMKRPFDTVVTLFAITVGLSILIVSPNKVQALLNPTFGFVSIASLTVLYFFGSREKQLNLPLLAVNISASLVAIVTVVMFFNPFAKVGLPTYLLFLKNPTFTPLGVQLDLAIFLGFFALYNLVHILYKTHSSSSKQILSLPFFVIQLIGLGFALYSLIINKAIGVLAPVSISWFSAVEVFKQPLTALFGIGVDNFSSIFTRTKDAVFNQSAIWQVSSFNVSRSALLHIVTETGLFGIAAFVLLILQMLNSARSSLSSSSSPKLPIYLTVLMVLLFVLTPPSFILFFLLFVCIMLFSTAPLYHEHENSTKTYNLSELPPVYLGITVISFIVLGAGMYLVGRTYASEYYFKQSLDGVNANNVKQVYENMRQAIVLNPYMEKYRLNFAQTNLLIANNIAAKTTQKTKDGKQVTLTDQERQTISQALQAAIEEAKATVSLNPQKAYNWENLALIYRNILNVAQGADAWTISAYQRAMVLDPQNPQYRLELGGVLYGLGNFNDASRLFEEAAALKSDWPNAYYNLAWSYYQQQAYQKAVSAMQSAIMLLNPSKDKADYEKATNELVEFKKKLPAEEEKAPDQAQQEGETQLTLPTPAPQQIEPKIELPEEASPEAR